MAEAAPKSTGSLITRRGVLRGLASLGILALAGCVSQGGEVGRFSTRPPAASEAGETAASGAAGPSVPIDGTNLPDCVLTPRQTDGPFYFDTGLVRRNITEGKPGTPLVVTLRIVDAASCAPIRDVVVDIWHSDAAGQYSGYRGQGDQRTDTSGEIFLRGMQVTDASGLVQFETIYPGWYPGRAVHIHFKAYAGQRSFVTSQMYFPDDITDTVFQAQPYSRRGPRNTRNEDDGVLIDNATGLGLLSRVARNETGYEASLTVGLAT